MPVMPLPMLPKKAPRTKPLSVRLSTTTVSQLKSLAFEHGLSQADVIECLLEAEFQRSKLAKIRDKNSAIEHCGTQLRTKFARDKRRDGVNRHV